MANGTCHTDATSFGSFRGLPIMSTSRARYVSQLRDENWDKTVRCRWWVEVRRVVKLRQSQMPSTRARNALGRED